MANARTTYTLIKNDNDLLNELLHTVQGQNWSIFTFESKISISFLNKMWLWMSFFPQYESFINDWWGIHECELVYRLIMSQTMKSMWGLNGFNGGRNITSETKLTLKW